MKQLKIYASFLLVFFLAEGMAQTGINTELPDSSAALHVVSPNSRSGVLIPQMTNIQARSIDSAATALTVYDQTNRNFVFYNGSSWGYYGATTECADNSCIASPQAGDMFFNTSTGFLEIFDGTVWQSLDVSSNTLSP